MLVLFIKYLNLTITQGMINVYANIVQTNKDSLLSSNEPGVRVLATFIAWLNLDSGIETCFFKDLDMYTKTWLQFVFPLYLWTLAGGIILACRYSTLTTSTLGTMQSRFWQRLSSYRTTSSSLSLPLSIPHPPSILRTMSVKQYTTIWCGLMMEMSPLVLDTWPSLQSAQQYYCFFGSHSHSAFCLGSGSRGTITTAG